MEYGKSRITQKLHAGYLALNAHELIKVKIRAEKEERLQISQ